MYGLVKKNDGTYALTEFVHYGKGHLDGGHSGRYPWGSGENPKQRPNVFQNPEHKHRIAKATFIGTLLGGPLAGATAGYISYRHILKEISKNEEELSEVSKKTLSEDDIESGKEKLKKIVDEKVDDNKTIDDDDDKIRRITADKNSIEYRDEIEGAIEDSMEIYNGFHPDYKNIKRYDKTTQEKMKKDIAYYKQLFGEVPDFDYYINNKLLGGDVSDECDSPKFKKYDELLKKHNGNELAAGTEFVKEDESIPKGSHSTPNADFLDRLNKPYIRIRDMSYSELARRKMK